MTLDEAYKKALSHVETMETLRSQIRQSDERIQQAKGRLLPELSASGTYQKFDASGGVARKDQQIGKVTLNQSLYAGGADKNVLEAREADRKARELNLTSFSNELFRQVATAFYRLMAADQEISNIRNSLSATRERLDELQKRNRIGKSRRSEVLSAQGQLSVIEAQLQIALGQAKEARQQFVHLTGYDDKVSLSDGTQLPAAPESFEKFIQNIENRPDLRSLKAQQDSYRQLSESYRGGHWPSLGFTGNYYVTRNDAYPDSKWDLGLSLTVPIYSGGIVQSQVREAKEREFEAEVAWRQRKREIETEIRVAYDGYLSAVSQIKSLEKALVATRQNYDELVKDYGFGQSTTIEVLQALNTFQDTKRSLDRARFEALLSWAVLKTASMQASTPF